MKHLTADEVMTLRTAAIGKGAGDFWALAHEVADLWGAKMTAITGPTMGDKTTCAARNFICLYAWRRGFSKRQIGLFLHRDRSSVLNAIRNAVAAEDVAKARGGV